MQLNNQQPLFMKTKFNIALIGGRGYVGQEIIHILNQHPNFELCKAFSRTAADTEVDGYNQHPTLKYSLLEDSNLDLDNIDIAILALSNGDSNKYVTEIDLKYPDMILIDISSDHRFNPEWQYRLPDISRVKATKKISNPGCYASAIQFSIEPIKNLISGRVSCFGVSGYSGAGASPNEKNNKVNLQDNVIPYSLQGHIHEQEVKKYCYENLSFSPHVGNFFRGILITSHIQLNKKNSIEEILSIYKDFYKNSSLINIDAEIPMLNKITKSHKVSIGGIAFDKTGINLTLCCVLDNLLKGAATQVIQNLNSACEIDELTGITYE